MFRKVPITMNRTSLGFAFTFFIFNFAGFAFADDFKSIVITNGGHVSLPRVHGDQFMVIRNFTQDSTAATRGVVIVTKPIGGTTVNILAAAILDMTPVE